MPSKGRPPRSNATKRLLGVAESPTGPVAARVEVVPPKSLSPGARGVWDRLAPDLLAKNVLDAWCVDAFGRLCWLVAASESLRAQIDAEGYVVPGARNDEPVKNRLWTLLRQVDVELLALESRFGLTPSERGRVNVEPGNAESDLLSPSRLLSGGDPSRYLT